MLDIYGKRITLRYNGEEYFKTKCGACATVVLVMTLVIVSLLHFKDIYLGVINRYDYMVHNEFSEEFWMTRGSRFKEPFEVLAFGLEDESLIRERHLEYFGQVTHRNMTQQVFPLTKCTDEVLANTR